MNTLFIAITMFLLLSGLAISKIKFRNKLIIAFFLCLLIISFLFLISVNKEIFEPGDAIIFGNEISKKLFLFFSFTVFFVLSGTQKAIKNEKTKRNKDGTPDMFLWIFLPFIYFFLFLFLLFKVVILTDLDIMLSFIITLTIGMPIAAAFKIIDGYKTGKKLNNKKIIYFISSLLLIVISFIVSLKL